MTKASSPASSLPDTATPSAGTGPAQAAPRPVVHHHGAVLGSLGLFTVLLGAALPLIDFFIVNVALPTIQRDLHAGAALLELVVAGYGLSYAVLLVLGGRLGDLFGRRRLFIAGMAAFGLTSLACGLAPDAWTLVAARVAQGAASALMLPQVLATIHSSTSGERRARAQSMYGATAGLAMVAGQILGGVLVAADIAGSGWRAIFLVNVPVALAGVVLAWRSVPETRSAKPAPIDVPGTVLLALVLTSLLAPLTEGRAAGWPVWTWVSLAAFPFLAFALYRVERRADREDRTPLVPPSLFHALSMRRGLVLILPFAIGFGGFMFVFAVALQQGLHLSAIAAGTALVPLAVTFFAASLAGPRLISRFGSRVVPAGAIIQGIGLALLAYTVWHGWPHVGTLALVPGSAVAGFGQGLQLPVLFRIVLSDVSAERAGVGSGVMVTTQQSALALGVATLGSLFLTLTGTGTAHMGDALAITLLTQVALVVVVVALAMRLPRRITT